MTEHRVSWKENRDSFGFVGADEWDWMQSEHMGGDNVLRVLLLAGSGHLKEMAKTLLDTEALRAAGFPWRVELVAMSEKPTDPVVAKRIKARKRIYRFLGEEQSDGSIQGPALDEYLAMGEDYCREQEIPFTFANPRDPEGKEWLMHVTRDYSRPFHIVIGNPWGTVVDWWIREKAGEISEPDHTQAPLPSGGWPRKLGMWKKFKTYGFAFGEHPNRPCGTDCGLQDMAGSTPVDRFLFNREERICLSLMAYGPPPMDNPELHLCDGPVMNLGLKYPASRLSRADMQRFGARYVEMTRQLSGITLLETLPQEIARRVHVLGRYHLDQGGYKS